MRQMKYVIRMVGAVIVFAALAGCASVNMNRTTVVTAAQPKTALVTFVRQSVLMGDGTSVDIWDGTHFLGALGAGKLIQVEVEPGAHLFLAKSDNWSYTSAVLEPGKKYFIKANIFMGMLHGGFALGVPNKSDTRVNDWLTYMVATSAEESERKAVETAKQAEVQVAIQNFKNGGVKSYSEIKLGDGFE